MRYLNKIVFINSAAVNYAEIELDGNVHFIGTQGVGKSTLLRAILFFYNANKTKLGIPREKMSFDEYYFPYQNSYIIYEVSKDEMKFCVLAYKVSGKVAFRFFEHNYQKELFISTDNRALATWEDIRAGFGRHIHYSKLITGYEEFRKIIYGDNKSLAPNFRKYALIESKQFQNIPRTIQNVFLNSNLEAKFIKDTIINSLSEDEFKIDLANYAHNHLRDFQTQINDIQIWFKKQRNGQILVKNQADRVIEKYRVLNFLSRDKKGFIRQLLMRMVWVNEQKPLLASELKRESEVLRKLAISRDNMQENHKKREQKLISDLDYLKKELQKAKEKQNAYELQDITAILEQMAQKDSLLANQKALLDEKNLLTTEFAELTQKYQALMMQISNREQEFNNQHRAKINETNAIKAKKIHEITENYQALLEQIQQDSTSEINLATEVVAQVVESINQVKNQQAELKYRTFFQEEIKNCQGDLQKLEKDVSTAKSIVFNCKNTMQNTRKAWENEQTQQQFKFDTQVEKSQAEQSELNAQIKSLEAKIAQSSTALYGWLNDNYPQWENTIAKVIDRSDVLFSTDLNPRLLNTTNPNFYGVELDLSQVPNKVKTLAEFKEEITDLQTELQRQEQLELEYWADHDAGLLRLKNKYQKQIKALQEAIAENEYNIERSKVRIKQKNVELHEWKQRSVEEKQAVSSGLEAELEKLTAERLHKDKLLENLGINLKRKVTVNKKRRDSEIQDLEQDFAIKIEHLESEIHKNSAECKQHLAELQSQESSELASRGANVIRLEQIEKSLLEIDNLLGTIQKNERLVIEYEKDKRELFDLVPELNAQRNSLEIKHKQLVTEQELALANMETKFAKQDALVKKLNSVLTVFATDEAEFEKFKKSELYEFCELNDKVSASTDMEDLSAQKIIAEIKDRHYQVIDNFKEMQQVINRFTGNFGERNIFKFATKFVSDREFMDFAHSLKEFIEEDKIHEYEKRVNERFANIVQQIAKETTELSSKEAEIEKVIKKINDDFVAKNFVQAIKEMEMRTQKSSNSIVKLLLKIKEFYDEHNLILGENNLFTSAESSTSNHQAVELLNQLIKELERTKNTTLTLSESFDLQFRIVENDNDSGWVEKLSNVGSEGTDVLVKAMINILLLNVFKDSASRKFKDFKLHCMMDEIGRLHPNNVQGILRFANERNILLINGSPTSQNAIDYKYTYKLSKEASAADATKYVTRVSRLVKVHGERTF